MGSTLDVSAFSDILKESADNDDVYTVMAGKGFACDDDFSLLEECGLNYMIPLRRGKRFVKGHVPASPFGYEEAFSFNGRGIHIKKRPTAGSSELARVVFLSFRLSAPRIDTGFQEYPVNSFPKNFYL